MTRLLQLRRGTLRRVALVEEANITLFEFVLLQDGDVMHISVEGYGRPLRNPVRIDKSVPAPLNVVYLG